jgi:hypothetical protein
VQGFVGVMAKIKAEADEVWRRLSSAAARQMIMAFCDAKKAEHNQNMAFAQDTLRTQFLKDLADVGQFPKNVLLAGFANGRGDGIANPVIPVGAKAVEYKCTNCHWANLSTFPRGNVKDKEVFALREDDIVKADFKMHYTGSANGSDSCPGGTSTGNGFFRDVYNAVPLGPNNKACYISHSCFIPSVSAVALKGMDTSEKSLYTAILPWEAGSYLNFYRFSIELNEGHVTISQRIAAFIMEYITKPADELRLNGMPEAEAAMAAK